MKVIIPRVAARRDVDEALGYYSRHAGRDVAQRFADALRQAYRTIAEQPGLGSTSHSKFGDVAELRTRKLDRFPYLVCYIDCADCIDVVRVLHSHRDLPSELKGD